MFTDFFDGVQSYGKAYRLIKEMRLWPYAIIPAIISLVIAVGVVVLAWSLSDNVGNFLLSWYPWDWGSDTISSISVWLGGAVVGLFGLIVFKYLVLIFSSPFMSFLSEKVEKNITGNQEKTSFSFGGALHDLARGFRISSRNFIRELFFTALFLLLGLVPIIGFLSPFLLFFSQAYYAGFGNLDYTLERHCSLTESTKFVRRHRFLAIGNGSVFLLLLMSGIGFLFAPPLATIAGTVESLERLRADKIVISKEQEFV